MTEGDAVSGSSRGPKKILLRFRGIPYTATAKEVEDFMGDHVKYVSIHIMSDQNGRHAGEAVVEFATEDMANEARKRNNEHIGRRYVEVMDFTEREFKTKLEDGGKIIDNAALIVKMRGLPYTATELEIREFFGDDVKILGIHITRSQGRPSGEAFIEVRSDEEMDQVMAKNRENMGKRYIELFPSNAAELSSSLASSNDKGSERISKDKGSSSGGRGDYDYENYDRGGYEAPRGEGVSCIHMRGIPFGTTEHDIVRFFEEVRVCPVRVHRKADGVEAFCEFAHSNEAATALTLDRRHMRDRYVEMFRVTWEAMADRVGFNTREH